MISDKLKKIIDAEINRQIVSGYDKKERKVKIYIEPSLFIKLAEEKNV